MPRTKVAADEKDAVAIVDPYSSGRFLVEELRRRNWPLIAVRSSLEIDEAYLGTWNPAPFEDIVVHHGDLAETISTLRSLRPLKAVIVGSEPGVELADALSVAFELRGNDPLIPRPRCRWDRCEMHAQLVECGLRVCQQKLCSSIEEAHAFARDVGKWPIVAKPQDSHGGAYVYFCKDGDALAEAVSQLLSWSATRTREAILVQECLHGDEYMVDCVSVDGEHLVVSMWALSKTKGTHGLAYDHAQMVPFDTSEGTGHQRLYGYVFRCLDALGLKNGASHSGIVLGEDGPCLIKTSARMHSAMGPALWSKCAGREQAQPYLVADIFTESGQQTASRLEAVKAGRESYSLDQVSALVDLHCHLSGVLVDSIEASAGPWLRTLPSYFGLRTFVEEGDAVVPTTNLSTSLGFVILVGCTSKQIQQDFAEIRRRERCGEMYRIEASFGGCCNSRRSRSYSLNPVSRVCELETEAEKLISPIASRAVSPLLSPQRAPMLPPEFGSCGDLFEFTLDGADDLDAPWADEVSKALEGKSDGRDHL